MSERLYVVDVTSPASRSNLRYGPARDDPQVTLAANSRDAVSNVIARAKGASPVGKVMDVLDSHYGGAQHYAFAIPASDQLEQVLDTLTADIAHKMTQRSGFDKSPSDPAIMQTARDYLEVSRADAANPDDGRKVA